MEAIQISMQGWVDKQNVVETYNGILFDLKMEVGIQAMTCMYLESILKWKKPVTKTHTLYDSSYMKCPQKTKSRLMSPGTGNGYRDWLKTSMRDLFGVMEMF